MAFGGPWHVVIWSKARCRFQKSLGFWDILKLQILHMRFTDGQEQIHELNGPKHGEANQA